MRAHPHLAAAPRRRTLSAGHHTWCLSHSGSSHEQQRDSSKRPAERSTCRVRSDIVVGIDESRRRLQRCGGRSRTRRTSGAPLRLVHAWQLSAVAAEAVAGVPAPTSRPPQPTPGRGRPSGSSKHSAGVPPRCAGRWRCMKAVPGRCWPPRRTARTGRRRHPRAHGPAPSHRRIGQPLRALARPGAGRGRPSPPPRPTSSPQEARPGPRRDRLCTVALGPSGPRDPRPGSAARRTRDPAPREHREREPDRGPLSGPGTQAAQARRPTDLDRVTQHLACRWRSAPARAGHDVDFIGLEREHPTIGGLGQP